ncbi:MAG: hypothetical protein CMO01_26030 [Thalassobius sp.]|nr:hypothetical protein [Thalassovita sp.]
MKTIIVATDYSNAASNALSYAAELANVINAKLVLFNVYHLNIHASNARLSPDKIDQMVKNNEIRLQELADETAQKYNLSVNWYSKMANTVEELEAYATTNTVDLVVMGMETNLMEYRLFGNTTTAAVRRLKFPVLVVPNEVPYKKLERVLYACEYKYLEKDNHLDLLKDLARKYNAQLQVLHVETKVKEAELADNQFISNVDNLMEDVAHTYNFVESSNISKGIEKGVNEFNADLLVMVPHKAGFLESIMKGSVTREMTLKTRVPLLVLPNL